MNLGLQNIFKRWDNHLHINIDRLPPEGLDRLPTQLGPFIWFFVRQIKVPVIGIAVLEGVWAALISVMFWYVGELVEQGLYSVAMIWIGICMLTVRFFTGTVAEIIYHLIYIPYVGNLVRRQLYWYTSKQSLAFFQNDFAGRIANKLLQSAPSLRDAVKSTIGAVWFATVFTISNLWFLTSNSLLLALPLIIWLIGYILTLAFFVPKVKICATEHSEDHSNLTGQVVDGFTNFLPIKYFARTKYEDRRVVGLLEQHSKSFRATTMKIWQMTFVIDILNVMLLVSTAAVGYYMIETQGQVGIAAIAMALPMVVQATFQSGWIMYEISGIFENLGHVQEGIDTLSKAYTVKDDKEAKALKVGKAQASIDFDNVTFSYGQEDRAVLENFNLEIRPGQKVGLVGKSGAGKSTIISLLVRAYDVEAGDILIGNQDIADVTQDSLREHITVVTQDSYLFHRSVLDNIRYGKPDASMDEVTEAAKRANAHEFILGLEDNKGRKSYEAHVGERGVKLSGGQKQRIGIARALLKDAPILILDEATSALDSESEQSIQNALEGIMEGKTVIAVAHRLSTLRQMDRILVMQDGQIIEDGTHTELARKENGHYALLWDMQSGGFMSEK